MNRALLLALMAISCFGAEPERPSFTIATVQINKITNELDYNRVRMLSFDKDTLNAIKDINIETAKMKKDIIDAKDEIVLMEIAKKIEFNNKKVSILRERNDNGSEVNIQKVVSEFVVKNFSSRFALILEDSNGFEGRVLYKNVKTIDITEEVYEAFIKALPQ